MNSKENSTGLPGRASTPADPEAAFMLAVAAVLDCAKALDPTIRGGWISRSVETGMPTCIGFDRVAQ